jgi:hypothetical protein
VTVPQEQREFGHSDLWTVEIEQSFKWQEQEERDDDVGAYMYKRGDDAAAEMEDTERTGAVTTEH